MSWLNGFLQRNYLKSIIFTTPIALALVACQLSDANQRKVVAEWSGREISIPENLSFQISTTDIEIDLDAPDFKVINYVDSNGCTFCRMKLAQWNGVIDEFKALPGVDIEILTIVNTVDIPEILFQINQSNYLHPIAIDSANVFDRTNILPTETDYHAFLLNADNEVLAIGNPVNNPKIKDLYRNIILEKSDIERFGALKSKSLGILSPGDIATVSFSLSDANSPKPHILDIIPSCDCVSASVNTRSNLGNDVIVTFVADSAKGSFIRHVDVFYHEKENPDRLTIYGYIK